MDRKKIIGVPERIEKKICVQLRIDRDELRDELLKRTTLYRCSFTRNRAGYRGVLRSVTPYCR